MSLLRFVKRVPASTRNEQLRLFAETALQNQRMCWSTGRIQNCYSPLLIKSREIQTGRNSKAKPELKAKEHQPPIPDFTPCETRKDPIKDEITAKTVKIPAKQKLNPKIVRQNVEGYVFTRYFDFLKDYIAALEKKFPSAVKVYRVFMDGVRDFYNDMKNYLKITKIANESPEGLKALNRKELELYMQLPRDMLKVAPALIGCSLPMVGYAAMALVFMYPNTFLTSHFWTIQQKAQFREKILKDRIKCNRQALRLLQAKIKSIENKECKDKLHTILGQLGSGFHPTVEQILDAKDVFVKPPFNLISLSGKHIKTLSKMHGVPSGFFKRFRLREHAFLVHYMDLAICREGGVHNMPNDAMRYSCYLRGLNPTNLSNEEMIDWLRNWIKVSTSINSEHISLFLHLPVLLAYNHTNNWQLIYGEKQK